MQCNDREPKKILKISSASLVLCPLAWTLIYQNRPFPIWASITWIICTPLIQHRPFEISASKTSHEAIFSQKAPRIYSLVRFCALPCIIRSSKNQLVLFGPADIKRWFGKSSLCIYGLWQSPGSVLSQNQGFRTGCILTLCTYSLSPNRDSYWNHTWYLSRAPRAVPV